MADRVGIDQPYRRISNTFSTPLMFTIAGLQIDSPLILAPLAGYSDLPFRLLCREYGAGLCYSEMISCHGLAYNQQKTIQMLASSAAERPVGFQLFGADIAMMAKAADLLNCYSPDLVDINMGCPVRKVTKKGAGAALMSVPHTAREIIKEVVKNSDSPVTVKFRKGVNHNSINCCDFARMVEDSGASAIIIHGRTWSQGFTGEADWDSIARVKQNVTIPVIGNGDILSHEQAEERLDSSGCDGVMIGRGALGNPWIFCRSGKPDSYHGICAGVLRHLELMEQHLDVERLLGCIKNHIGRYFKNLKNSSAIRRSLYQSESFTELRNYISDVAHITAA